MAQIPSRPAPRIEALQKFYCGLNVDDIPKPAVILDVAVSRRHCNALLSAVEDIGVDFRAHVKTHKLARLQVGDKSPEARFIVSTLAEIEHLLPMFKEIQAEGRQVNILYGIPLPPSQTRRLAHLARELGPGSICVLLDHVTQFGCLESFFEIAGFPAGIYIKIDTGYHRAGLPPNALNKHGLLERLAQLEKDGRATFVGIYSHNSLGYNDNTAAQAMMNLEAEIKGCMDALHANESFFPSDKDITISVGASPQVVSIRNLQEPDASDLNGARRLSEMIRRTASGKTRPFRTRLELHAGVYAVFDMQQMATRPMASLGDWEDEVAVSVVAEVCSVYNDGERRQPEALLAVGTLGLGREPCPSYAGWAVVSQKNSSRQSLTGKRRLVVERISQEHSIVSWEVTTAEDNKGFELPPIPLEIGETVRLVPNHACVTGAMYGWYLIVDSEKDPSASKIVDVWTRASGW
ncbi:alanine racemase domain protein [Colletotrichum tofieldiae]|nr:alanine racemase domain protein [Colletotrichum tofieldiae]